MNVLVVEDSARMAKALEKGLKEECYAVDVATSGVDGLHMAVTGEYDLVLLDMVLPGWNGPDVLRRVLRHWPGQRVLMISPYPLPDQEELALHEGAVGVFLKPFAEPDLPRAVREALDRPPPAAMLTGPV